MPILKSFVFLTFFVFWSIQTFADPTASQILQISAGDKHTCVLKSDGTANCWGDVSGYRQNFSSHQYVPIQVSDLNPATQLATGKSHNCALLESKSVYCWGSDEYGQLGDGSANNGYVNDLGDVQQIAVHHNHSCALLENGTAKCWGSGSSYQLGNGSSSSQTSPVTVNGVGDIKQLALGSLKSCALLNNGTVYCWGAGQSLPYLVNGLGAVDQLAISGSHTCALLSDETVACWGYNAFGQLGNGDNVDQSSPVTVSGLNGVEQLALGSYHSCALLSDGTVECWGWGQEGILGNGQTTNQNTPVVVEGLSGVIEITAGSRHTCALLNDSSVQCWGTEIEGRLATDSLAERMANGDGKLPQSIPVVVREEEVLSNISLNYDHACAVMPDGRVSCWGKGEYGQLGNNDLSDRSFPTIVEGLSSIAEVAAGRRHSCALSTAGTVQCWGNNNSGTLGNGTMISSSSPTDVVGLSSVKQIVAGSSHSCALTDGGLVYCWGYNAGGLLGIEDYGHQSSPVQVQNLSNVVYISATSNYSCAVLNTGNVYCWGFNRNGSLGAGSSSSSSNVPLEVVGVSTATAVSTYSNPTCALLQDETLRCWGTGFEHADGGSSISYVPLGFEGFNDVKQLSGSCLLRHDGTVWCWGSGFYGALGNGSLENQDSPVQVIGITDAVSISSNGGHACATLNDGSTRCWGNGYYGVLGDGNPGYQSSPHRVGNLFRPGNGMIDLPDLLIGERHVLEPTYYEDGLKLGTSTRYDYQYSSKSPNVYTTGNLITLNEANGGAIEVTHKGTQITKRVYVFPPTEEVEIESNDQPNAFVDTLSATPIGGRLYSAQDQDHFRFVVSESQLHNFFFVHPGGDSDFQVDLLTDGGQQIFHLEANEGSHMLKLDVPLTPGTYYLRVTSGEDFSTDLYSVMMVLGAPFCNSNNDSKQACNIEMNTDLVHTSQSDSTFVTFSTQKPIRLNLELTAAQSQEVEVSLLSSSALSGVDALIDFEGGLLSSFAGDWELKKHDDGNTVVQSKNVSESCSILRYPLGFEKNMPVSFQGDWTITNHFQASQGFHSLQSAPIGHDETSSFETEALTGTSISFDYRISSESSDRLVFYVDGEESASWSGITGWQSHELALSEGLHQFKWVYEKDSSGSQGQDSVWLDNLNIGILEPCLTPPSVLSIEALPSGPLSFKYRKQGDGLDKKLEVYVNDQLQASLCENESCADWQNHQIIGDFETYQIRWQTSGDAENTVFEVDEISGIKQSNLLEKETLALQQGEPRSISFYMKPGSYVVRVRDEGGSLAGLSTVLSSFDGQMNREYEPNNRFSTAKGLQANQTVGGKLSSKLDQDTFAFHFASRGTLDFELQPSSENTEFQLLLYRGDGSKVQHIEWTTSGDNLLADRIGLQSGNYFLRVLHKPEGTFSSPAYYSLTIDGDIEARNHLLSLDVTATFANSSSRRWSILARGYYSDGSSKSLTHSVRWFLSEGSGIVEGDSFYSFKEEPFTLNARYQGLVGSQRVLYGTKEESHSLGNAILIASSKDRIESHSNRASLYLAGLAYKKIASRGLKDQDIFYFNRINDHDFEQGSLFPPIVDSNNLTVSAVESALTEWAPAQSTSGPLVLYLVGNTGANGIELSPGEVLTPMQLDALLDTFQTASNREVIVIVEGPRSGTFVDLLKQTDRLIITSTDTTNSYTNADGSQSFSQILWDKLSVGDTFEEAFDSAKSHLTAWGKPYDSQVPQWNSDSVSTLQLGGDFELSQTQPVFTSTTLRGTVQAQTPVTLFAKTLNIESDSIVTAAITPPQYFPPVMNTAFDFLDSDLPEITLRDTHSTSSTPLGDIAHFEGDYTFVFNGTHQVVFTVKDQNHNLVSSAPVNIEVTDGIDSVLWDLVSFSGFSSSAPSGFFSTDQKAKINTVWGWDGQWKIWSPSLSIEQLNANFGGTEFEELTELKEGTGYWINSSTSLSFTNPTSSSFSPTLQVGWNLVGFGNDQEGSVESFLENNPNILSMWAWNGTTWHLHMTNNRSNPFPLLEHIQAGKGYWIKVQQ